MEAELKAVTGTGEAQTAEGAGEEVTPGGRAVAAARKRGLASAGAKGVALTQGVAGSGDPKTELGAAVTTC